MSFVVVFAKLCFFILRDRVLFSFLLCHCSSVLWLLSVCDCTGDGGVRRWRERKKGSRGGKRGERQGRKEIRRVRRGEKKGRKEVEGRNVGFETNVERKEGIKGGVKRVGEKGRE